MENQNRKKIVHNFLQNPTWSGAMIAKKLKLPKSTVNDVIKRYRGTLSTDRKKKETKKVSRRDQDLATKIVRSIKQNPGLSDNDRAKKYKTSRSTARRIRLDAGLRSYRSIKYPNRTEKQNITAVKRSRVLYEQVLTKFNNCLIMDDETYVKMDLQQLPGRKFYVAESRGNVNQKYKYTKMDKFGKKVMVWQAICSCGLKSAPFVTSTTMTSDIYIKECLQKRLLPFIRQHHSSVKFWPDLASCHYSKAAMDWYRSNKVDVIPKHMNPPNCPQLRPIEKYWAIVKAKLKKNGSAIIDNKKMLSAWNKYAAQVDRKVVQKLMGTIKSKTRIFIRNKDI